MNTTSCDKITRNFLLVLNLAFAVLGLVLIALGFFFHVDAIGILDFLGVDHANPPIFIIILGAIIFVVAFFGCCGAIKHNKCMLWTYSFLLLLLLIAQIATVIAVYHWAGSLSPAIKTNMQEAMKNYGALDHHGVDFTWDNVQTGLQCCGVNTWTDWQNVTTRGLQTEAVPDSCCRNRQEGCGKNATEANVYNQGCYDTFSRTLTDNINYIGGTGLSVAVAELVIISIACWLGKRMGRASSSQPQDV